MQDSTGTTTFTYDAVRRLNTVKYPANKTITYSFDEVGNRSVMVDPDSGRTTYSHDAANNLTSLLNPFNERTTFTYDALNRAVTVTHANTTKAEHDYNAAGWLTALRNLKSDNTPISIFTYTYDNTANRLSMSEANGDRVTWTYDAIYQLTRERRSGANSFDITYSYDPVGNRLTKLQSGTTTTYSYDSANELTTEQAGATVTTYSFDNNGNTTLKNAGGSLTTYTWDKENRMTKLEQPTSPAVMTFTYDANSFRRTLHDGTHLTKFLNDWVTGTPGLDPVLKETDGSDSTIVTYTPALLHGLLSQRRSSVSKWYHFEGIGSTRQLTDASQIVTDTYTYEAFGKEVVTTGTTANALRFVGQLNYYTDGKSRLVLLGRRWYDPARAVFATRDPNSSGQRYLYANARPTLYVDPLGLYEVYPGCYCPPDTVYKWPYGCQDYTGGYLPCKPVPPPPAPPPAVPPTGGGWGVGGTAVFIVGAGLEIISCCDKGTWKIVPFFKFCVGALFGAAFTGSKILNLPSCKDYEGGFVEFDLGPVGIAAGGTGSNPLYPIGTVGVSVGSLVGVGACYYLPL